MEMYPLREGAMKNPELQEGSVVTFFDGLTGKPLGGEGVVTRIGWRGDRGKLFCVAQNGRYLGWFGPRELKLKQR